MTEQENSKSEEAEKKTHEGAEQKKPRVVPTEVTARLGSPKSLDNVSDEQIKAILKEYYDRWMGCESDLYDIEHSVKVKEMQIHELQMEVSDMRGRFIIPKLKKVPNFKLTGNDE